MTHLGEPRFAFDGAARGELPRSKAYEGNNLLNVVTPLKHMEFCKDGGNRCLADPKELISGGPSLP
jgi:hypothetical protein